MLTSSNNLPSSSIHVSSSPPDSSTPPIRSEPHEIPPNTESRDEPARPLFGVDALMDSIKQAIQKRQDTLEHSDDMSSRRSSFSSSPPNSPLLHDTSTKPELPPPKPSLPNKPSELLKTASTKPPVPSKPQISNSGPMALPNAPKKSPRAPPAPPIPPKKGNDDSQPSNGSARSELLKSIEKGSNLRKTVTNDRSAPRI